MRVLSMHQPWASLVAEDIKTVETRSWRPPAGVVGGRIGIHSTQRRPRIDECPPSVYWPWVLAQPRGMVIATVRLARVGRLHRIVGSVGWACEQCAAGTARSARVYARIAGDVDGFPVDVSDGLGDYTLGRLMWQFDQVEVLPEPVAARGYQRLWHWQPWTVEP